MLEYRNRKVAVIEAKRWSLPISEGVQQAKDYAKKLDVRFTYSSNGQGFYEIDMRTGTERHLTMDEFPTPEQLWEWTFDTEDELRDALAEVHSKTAAARGSRGTIRTTPSSGPSKPFRTGRTASS